MLRSLILILPLILGLGVRRLRAVLSLVASGREVAGILAGVVGLDLCTNVFIGSIAGREDRLREGGWCCGEDALIGGSVVAVVAISSSS